MLDRATRARAEPTLRSALASAIRSHGGGPVERLELSIGSSCWAWGRIDDQGSSLLVRVTSDWLRTVGMAQSATQPGEPNTFVVQARLGPTPALVVAWAAAGDGAVVARLAPAGPTTRNSEA